MAVNLYVNTHNFFRKQSDNNELMLSENLSENMSMGKFMALE